MKKSRSKTLFSVPAFLPRNDYVLGLDLSLNHTGVAVFGGAEYIWSGVLHMKTERGAERLSKIMAHLRELTEKLRPREVVLEGYSFGSRGRAIFNIGELGGVVRLWFYEQGIPVQEVPPTSLKKAITGHGNATKEEMVAEINRLYGLNLRDDNEADAIGLCRQARGSGPRSEAPEPRKAA